MTGVNGEIYGSLAEFCDFKSRCHVYARAASQGERLFFGKTKTADCRPATSSWTTASWTTALRLPVAYVHT